MALGFGVIKLSVNVNKVATIRNSRGGTVPSVLAAVRTCVGAGAPGITVHPRADARHITADDVREIARELASLEGRIEYNIEGDPQAGPARAGARREARPVHAGAGQAGEITSQAGWSSHTPRETSRAHGS